MSLERNAGLSGDGSSGDLRARVLAAAKAEAAPTRGETRRASARMLGMGFAVEAALFVAIGMLHRGPRPDWLIASMTGGTLLVALAASFFAIGRGGSMLGRPRVVLLATIAAIPIALLAWTAAINSGAAPEQLGTWSSVSTLRCFSLTALLSIGPAVAFLSSRRASDPVHPGTTAAAIGAAAAAWAIVGMSLLCPDQNFLHLMVGHYIPTLAVALAGAFLGARFVSLRPNV